MGLRLQNTTNFKKSSEKRRGKTPAKGGGEKYNSGECDVGIKSVENGGVVRAARTACRKMWKGMHTKQCLSPANGGEIEPVGA